MCLKRDKIAQSVDNLSNIFDKNLFSSNEKLKIIFHKLKDAFLALTSFNSLKCFLHCLLIRLLYFLIPHIQKSKFMRVNFSF